jgi:hypothetical protein
VAEDLADNGPVKPGDDSDLFFFSKDDPLEVKWKKLEAKMPAAVKSAEDASGQDFPKEIVKEGPFASSFVEEGDDNSAVLEEDELAQGGQSLLSMGEANFAQTDSALKQLAVAADSKFAAILAAAKAALPARDPIGAPVPARPSSLLEEPASARLRARAEAHRKRLHDLQEQRRMHSSLAETPVGHLPTRTEPANWDQSGPPEDAKDLEDTLEQQQAKTQKHLDALPRKHAGEDAEEDAKPSSLAETRSAQSLLGGATSQGVDQQYMELETDYKQHGRELRQADSELANRLRAEEAEYSAPPPRPSSLLETPQTPQQFAAFDAYFKQLDGQTGAALQDAEKILGPPGAPQDLPGPSSLLQAGSDKAQLREHEEAEEAQYMAAFRKGLAKGYRRHAGEIAEAETALDAAEAKIRDGRLALAREKVPVIGAGLADLEKQMRADDLK